MEEKTMKETRLKELTSSERLIRGGAGAVSEIMAKIKSLINFLADYIPKLIEGFTAGFKKAF